MNDADDICKHLRSEKQTDRNKGKKRTEELLQSTDRFLPVSARDWALIILAALEYESKEFHHAQARHVQTKLNSTIFVRKVIVQAIGICLLQPQTALAIANHSLLVLHSGVDMSIKRVHLDIICDILRSSVVQSLPLTFFQNIFCFIDASITEKKDLADPLYLRILVLFCSSLVSSNSRQGSMTNTIISWLVRVIVPLAKEGTDELAAVVPCLAECLFNIASLESIDVIYSNLENLAEIFSVIFGHVRIQLSSNAIILKSLMQFMNFLLDLARLFPDVTIPSNVLMLCEIMHTTFVSESFIIAGATMIENSSNSRNKKCCDISHLLEVSRVALHFRSVATSFETVNCLFRNQHFPPSCEIFRVGPCPGHLMYCCRSAFSSANILKYSTSQEILLTKGYLSVLWFVGLQSTLKNGRPELVMLSATDLCQCLSLICNACKFVNEAIIALQLHEFLLLALWGLSNLTLRLVNNSDFIASDVSKLKDLWASELPIILAIPWISSQFIAQKFAAKCLTGIVFSIHSAPSLNQRLDAWNVIGVIWDYLCASDLTSSDNTSILSTLAAICMYSKYDLRSAISKPSSLNTVREACDAPSPSMRMICFRQAIKWMNTQIRSPSHGGGNCCFDELYYALSSILFELPKANYFRTYRNTPMLCHKPCAYSMDGLWEYSNNSYNSLVYPTSNTTQNYVEHLLFSALHRYIDTTSENQYAGKKLSPNEFRDVCLECLKSCEFFASSISIDDDCSWGQLNHGLMIFTMCLCILQADILVLSEFNSWIIRIFDFLVSKFCAVGNSSLGSNFINSVEAFYCVLQGYQALGLLTPDDLSTSRLAFIHCIRSFGECIVVMSCDAAEYEESDEEIAIPKQPIKRIRYSEGHGNVPPLSNQVAGGRMIIHNEEFPRVFQNILLIAKVAMMCGVDDSFIYSNIRGCVFSGRESQRLDKVVCDQGYYFKLVDFALTTPSSSDTMQFIDWHDWSLTFSAIDYCFLLDKIRESLFVAGSPINVGKRDHFKLLFRIVFAEDPAFQQHEKACWFVRTALLRCMTAASGVESIASGNSFKDSWKSHFLECLTDSDLRVRLYAAEAANTVIKLFRNHNRIYDACKECIGVEIKSLNDSPRGAEVWKLIPFADTLATLANSSLELLVQATHDIIKTFSTRRQLSSNGLILFPRTLNSILEFIANSCGYEDIAHLLEDNLYPLLRFWAGFGQSNVMNRLTFEFFPIHLFYQYRCNSELPNGLITLQLNVISQVTEPQFRWDLLVGLAQMMGQAPTDSFFSSIIRRNIGHLRACEILLSNIFSHESFESFGGITAIDSVQAFISRFDFENAVDNTSNSLLRASLSEIFELVSIISKCVNFEDVGNIIRQSVLKLGRLCQVNLEGRAILNFTNGIEILGSLRRTMLISRYSSAQRCALCAIKVLADINSDECDVFLLESIVKAVSLPIKCWVNGLDLILMILQTVTESCKNILSVSSGSSSNAVVAMELLNCIYLRVLFLQRMCNYLLVNQAQTFDYQSRSVVVACAEKFRKLLKNSAFVLSLVDCDATATKLCRNLIDIDQSATTGKKIGLVPWHLNRDGVFTVEAAMINVDIVLDQIERSVSILDQSISGHDISFVDIHCQLAILLEIIEGYISCSNDQTDNLWSVHPELMSKLVSATIGICTFFDSRTIVSIDESGIFRESICNSAIRIIGNLGLPDLFSIHPDKISNRNGNLLRRSNFDCNRLIQCIIEYVYELVWSRDPLISSTALKVLGSIQCFTSERFNSVISPRFCNIGKFYSRPSTVMLRLDRKVYRRLGPLTIWDENSSIWQPSGDYQTWVTHLVAVLIDECYSDCKSNVEPRVTEIVLKEFIDLVAISTELAENILPIIMLDILVNNGQESKYCLHIASQFTKALQCTKFSSLRARQVICYSFVFLLHQNTPNCPVNTLPPIKSYGYDIKPLDLAKFASTCNLSCVAQLCLELARSFDSESQSSFDGTMNELLCDILPGGHDPDALFGVNLNGPNLYLQARQYECSDSWGEALTSYESILQSGNSMSHLRGVALAGLKRSLTGIGLGTDRVTRLIPESGSNSDICVPNDRASTEAIIGLSSWGQLENRDQQGREASIDFIETYLTNACSMQHANCLDLQEQLPWAGKLILNGMQGSLLDESLSKIVRCLGQAQRFVELSEVISTACMLNSSRSTSMACTSVARPPCLLDSPFASALVTRWSYRLGARSNVSNRHSILMARLSLVSGLFSYHRSEVLDSFRLFQISVSAIKSRNEAHAFGPIFYKIKGQLFTQLDSECDDFESNLLRVKWFTLESRFLWVKGLSSAAQKCMSEQVIEPVRKLMCFDERVEQLGDILSDALLTRGEWAIATKSISGNVIITHFLLPAAASAQSTEQTVRCHCTMGKLYSRLYSSIKAKVTSKEWDQASRVVAARRMEYDRCKLLIQAENGKQVANNVLKRHANTLRKEIEMDEFERIIVAENESQYLLQALRSICLVLQVAGHDDIEITLQLVNLWLQNCSRQDVNKLLSESLISVPSFKFIPVIHQLFSRLNDTHSESNIAEFQATLSTLILRICEEHPHHSLPQLYALMNSVSELGSCTTSEGIGRSRAAELLMQKLTSHRSDQLKKLTISLKILLDSYVTLAKCSIENLHASGTVKQWRFSELQDRKSRLFAQCLNGLEVRPSVISCPIPVNMDGDYRGIVRCLSFQPTFAITESGISRPKIIECCGSDGVCYKQLVKGGDDMRQDAVMQQVFLLMNRIFLKDPESCKRNMLVRTYKIVPTTPQTGVVQWVDNTIPFGQYLCDKETGAHQRYFPSDWCHRKCRDHLRDADPRDADDKRRRLEEIFKKFRPAFRFFLLEKYADPAQWLARRLAYTKSVAAASIVGYILGIGDRHAHNILIDFNTAEVIHIDFGIVFEQGKGLGIPETVPFRLTRDIVDAMGINECEGTFRRSCEATLQVMRQYTTLILIILEVVIYDPLYKWSLSPQKARQRQPMGRLHAEVFNPPAIATDDLVSTSSQFSRDSAERALARIKDKLCGLEDPTGDALSVEGQIQHLISEARSIDNLCRIFPGWAPWL